MNTALTAREVLLRVWAAGSAVTLALFIASFVRFRRELKKDRTALDRGSGPAAYVSGAAETPCLVGLFRPTIYVTPQAAEDETELRHVLVHEETHLRHGDNLWSLLRCLCVAVHWFNPLVWWAAARSCGPPPP